VKSTILELINNVLFYPIQIKYCSQTIYQTLLGCVRLWDATHDEKWEKRAKIVCEILMRIQSPDGGFDIGYDFNFGRLHKKGEPTSPELIGLMALVEYYKRFGGDHVATAAKKAANWISNNAIQLTGDKWAIPYAPYSIKEIMVYNGTSFAAGALGVYLPIFPNDKLETIYHGMNRYLYGVLSSTSNQPGQFWYYSDQSRTDLTELQRDKIDYYHQMQQVEMHVEAELCLNSPYQTDLIFAASEHVAYKQDGKGVIPYTNRKEYFSAQIHLWGYCSCASGFIMAGKVLKSKSEEFKERAERIYNWIYQHAWNGEHFYRIISKDDSAIDSKFYVRSDAWVFNSFSLAVKEGINAVKYLDVCERTYRKIEKSDFSGIENHASNRRIRLMSKILLFISNLIRTNK